MRLNSRGLVMRASFGHRPNVYVIGPYGARVSFASQQRRALNLVWALRQSGAWPRENRPKVIVIGGGISGITAAVACMLHDCKVCVYEEKDEILSLQKNANHRHVHPTINFWPEDELCWTTEFPFLNWYASLCDNVIRNIHEEFNAHFRRHISNIYTDRKFIKFLDDHDIDQSILKIRFKNSSGVSFDDQADMVFFATGYGKEKDLARTNPASYWNNDHIDDSPSGNRTVKYVSGTGDGGIIDALRLTYKNFMKDKLAIKAISTWATEGCEDDIENFEFRAQFLDDPNTRAEYFYDKYKNLSRDRSHILMDALGHAIDWMPKQPINIIGEFSFPFDVGVAPIHKLITAYALDNRHIRYTKGQIVPTGNRMTLRVKGEPDINLRRDAVIVRHGATPPIIDFPFSITFVEKLRSRQIELADFLEISDFSSDARVRYYSDLMRNLIDQDAIHLKRNVDKRNVDMASSFMREEFELPIKFESGKIVVEPSPEERQKFMSRRHLFPTKLFGFEIELAQTDSPLLNELVGRA